TIAAAFPQAADRAGGHWSVLGSLLATGPRPQSRRVRRTHPGASRLNDKLRPHERLCRVPGDRTNPWAASTAMRARAAWTVDDGGAAPVGYCGCVGSVVGLGQPPKGSASCLQTVPREGSAPVTK